MDRTHQEKFARLKQEMSVINETLSAQHQVFASLLQEQKQRHRLESFPHHNEVVDARRDRYNTVSITRAGQNRAYHSQGPAQVYYVSDDYINTESKLLPTDSNGFREILARSCADLTQTKLQRFQEMEFNATDLERRVSALAPPRLCCSS